MLYAMLQHRQLKWFVNREGGFANQLFGGAETTDRITAEVTLKIGGERYDYRFVLEYAHSDGFYFGEEAFRRRSAGHPVASGWHNLGKWHNEANLFWAAHSREFPQFDQDCRRRDCERVGEVRGLSIAARASDPRSGRTATHRLATGWILTSATWRRCCTGWSGKILPRYQRICRYVGRLLPGFASFDIEEKQGKVALRWRNDWSDYSLNARLASENSLRLFALVTLLNMPPAMLPDVVLLDEPELGLHPAGVSLIGGMIRSLSTQKQIIVATQAPRLVDAFGLDQIFVFELREGRTEVRQCDPDQYRHWLDEYSTGELWEKNLLGGRP